MTIYIANVGAENAAWLADPINGPMPGCSEGIASNGDGTVSIGEGGIAFLRGLPESYDGVVDEERDDDGWETGMLRIWIQGDAYPLTVQHGGQASA